MAKKIYLSEVKKGNFFLDPLNRNKKKFIQLNTVNCIDEHKTHLNFCNKVVLSKINEYFRNCKKKFKHKKELKFFSILYLPIFTHIIQSFYFKYIFLKKIDKKKFIIEKVRTNNLKKININQFTKLLRVSEKLNNSMITDISENIGIKTFFNFEELSIKINGPSIKEYILDKLKVYISFLSVQISSFFYKDKILIHDGVLSLKKTFRILILSKFRITYFYLSKFTKKKYKKELNLFNKENNGIISFQNLCSNLMEKYLPRSYDFDLIKNIKSLRVKKGTIIITKSLSSPDNINFRVFLAANFEKLKIYSIQHGGGYGYLKDFYLENYEKSISKKFLTWGWKKDRKDQIFSADEIKIKKKIHVDNKKILLIGSNFCKYDYRFSSEPNSSLIFNNSSYVQNKKKLIKEISKNYNLIYKPHEVNNWYKELINIKKSKNFSIDTNNNLMDLALKSKLIIVCHLSTAFLESLNLDKPLILFLEKNFYNFTKIAKKDFEKLKRVGILHYNVKSIKNLLRNNKIDKWWLNKNVQKARKEFLYKFFHTEKNHDKNLLEYSLKQ